MQDPRTNLLENIDISSIRIEFSGSPIVLLCGGKVPSKENPNDLDPPISSFRHAITNSSTEFELFRPEEINDWHTDGIFKNLMDFEADLAGICSLVVIILESPGSIAELGAFSQLDDLSKKLIVFKSTDFNGEQSFISLGILRYISENHESSVKCYPWTPSKGTSISDELIEDACNDIQDELKELPKSQVLNHNKNTHTMVLICEIVRLFVALKESEILEYLVFFNVNISKHELRSKLFLLVRFKLVKKEAYGGGTFYLCKSNTFHKIRISLKDGKHIDSLRLTVDCAEYYNKSPNERNRTRAIQHASYGVII